MIIYNSRLAKLLLGKKKYYFMFFGCCFTRYKYLEAWEYMELQIHERQYFECLLLALFPSLILSICFSWWLMLLALASYHLLYWLERALWHHSTFDWEALEHCGDSLYLRKRKFPWCLLTGNIEMIICQVSSLILTMRVNWQPNI